MEITVIAELSKTTIHVEKKIKQIFKGMPEEQIREFAIYGMPEDILKQIDLLEQVDIQYLIVDLEPSRELEALDVFANKL